MTCTPVDPPAIVADASQSTGSDAEDKSSKMRRSLSFGKVEVREYERIITDDDPFVSLGLALGWNYRDGDAIPLHEKEERRSSSSSSHNATFSNAYVRTPLSTSERLKILSKFGYSNKELIAAERSRVNGLEYVSSCPCIPLMILKRNVKSMCKGASKKALRAPR